MSATIAGIQTYYAASSATVTALTLWLDQAKDVATFPYAVLHDGGGPTKLAFSSGTYRQPRFTIRGLGIVDTTLGTWQAAVIARFHRASLTITGATALSCLLQDEYFRLTKMRDQNNLAVYEATCIFRLEVETSA
jgi:hypothetical protein